jgi:hypothetical protein
MVKKVPAFAGMTKWGGALLVLTCFSRVGWEKAVEHQIRALSMRIQIEIFNPHTVVRWSPRLAEGEKWRGSLRHDFKQGVLGWSGLVAARILVK